MSCPVNCAECNTLLTIFRQKKKARHTGMYLDGVHVQGVADSVRNYKIPGRPYDAAKHGPFAPNLTPHFNSLVSRKLLRRLTQVPAWYELV